MTEKCIVEVFVLVDAVGDAAIGTSEQEARENYEREIQSLADADGFRLVKVSVAVPLPAVVELTAEAAELDQPAVCSVT